MYLFDHFGELEDVGDHRAFVLVFLEQNTDDLMEEWTVTIWNFCVSFLEDAIYDALMNEN